MNRLTSLPRKTTVKHAADFLILTHGRASITAVRKRLQEIGFSLQRQTISALLELIAKEQGWVYCEQNSTNGYYALSKSENKIFAYDFSLN
jgi:hypothetical protein